MIGKIFGIMSLISVIFGVTESRMEEISLAVFEGADTAVSLTISLCGAMCLWGGIMEVLRVSGIIGAFSRIISPLLRIFFTNAFADGNGKDEISACIAANLLGIGNAATPLAISAIKKLHESAVARGEDKYTASGDMITLAVLNSASANLLPTTIITLRRAAGALRPFAVVAPIWICSFSSAALALILCRGLGIRKGKKNGIP